MLVSPESALDQVVSARRALIDVRSEGEYAQGHIDGFSLAPILKDPERHLVGIEYKERGQDAAIVLGHELVDPHAAERLANWRQITQASPEREAIVMCWRGGLRSKLVTDQLLQAGERAARVEGGYKAMRNLLLQVLAAPPPLMVLGGLTGSGKTRLLRALPLREAVDLEGFAHHKGSTFGSIGEAAQPSQATFENRAAMRLRGLSRDVILEDESVMIGRLRLPMSLYEPMQKAAVIFLEADVAERTRNIHDDYIVQPLRAGVPIDRLSEELVAAVRKLSKRLGSELALRIERGVAAALAAGAVDREAHAPWIEMLLREYYDKAYRFAFERSERKIAFRGNYEECRQWIMTRYA